MKTFLAIPELSDVHIRTSNSNYCSNIVIYKNENEISKDKKVLVLRGDEEIISCQDIEKINKFCIKSGEWLIKDNQRIYWSSHDSSAIPIFVKTSANMHPCISEENIKNAYKEKDFLKFANLAERFFFENGQRKDIFLLYYLSVILFFKLNRFKEAQDKLALLLNSNDNLAEGWCLLGDFLVHKKIYHEAKRAYGLAIKKGQNRDIYDDLPVWPKKYNTYPQNKIDEIDKLIQSTKVISVDNF